MEYTRGPWKLELINNENIQEWRVKALSNTEMASGFYINDGGEVEVGLEREEIEIVSRWLDEPFNELDANMQLISATPELFESCVVALNELRKHENVNPFVLKYLENTLQKATLSEYETKEIEGEAKRKFELEKDYDLYKVDDGYMFDINFWKAFVNEEDEEKNEHVGDCYYSVIFDETGDIIDNTRDISNDFSVYEERKALEEINETEKRSVQLISNFLKENSLYLKQTNPNVIVKNIREREGNEIKEIEFSFEKKGNQSLYCFINKKLQIKRIYLQLQDEGRITLTSQVFEDFDELIGVIEKALV